MSSYFVFYFLFYFITSCQNFVNLTLKGRCNNIGHSRDIPALHIGLIHDVAPSRNKAFKLYKALPYFITLVKDPKH